MGVAFAVIAGAATGVLSGMGVGGGTLLLIYLTWVCGSSLPQARGTNLLYFIPCSAAALIGHIKNKLVDTKTAIPAIIAGAAATGIVSFFVSDADSPLMRRVFGGFLVAVGLLEMFRKNSRH